MNAEKLSKLQSQVRIGGKGTARRKKKVVHRTSTTDDKKLQSTLKKMTVSSIPGIEEVNMFKDDGTMIHFNNPKVQAALSSNTFAITGQAEDKRVSEMMPGILNQMRTDNANRLNNLAELLANPLIRQKGQGGAAGADDLDIAAAANGLEKLSKLAETPGAEEDDDVPQLVQNFDEAAQINETN